MTREQFEDVSRRAKVEEASELGQEWQLPIVLDSTTAMAVCANLQLALRHPGNRGPTADVARKVVAGIIEAYRECGLLAHAQLAELGNNSEHDVECEPREKTESRVLLT